MEQSSEKEANFERKERIFLRPCLIVLSGIPLTGKTVLAEKLVSISNLEMIDVDVVRNKVDESRKKDGKIRMLEPEEEKQIMIKSYTKMCQRAERTINGGIPAIITGTFSRIEFKQPLEQLVGALKKKGIPIKVLLTTAPDEEILKRIEKRKENGSFSNIDSLEKYHWAKGIFSKIEFAPVEEVDTSKPVYFEQTLKNLEDFKR